ncbi:hypothetical protein An11g02260 [Aspergillus niger]|uniref:Uncharacterized protein n=2 Tax=Aspergillus niger TaxID=5061 RepID=A2QVQ3_ASPNC|nr:hypothetical protein An11g02260 [Aspergillus niger]CAK40585.1 hypothetical protein An11g02260 [Aspergillus niger]
MQVVNGCVDGKEKISACRAGLGSRAGLGVIAPHPAIKAIETSDEKIKIISGWMDSPYPVYRVEIKLKGGEAEGKLFRAKFPLSRFALVVGVGSTAVVWVLERTTGWLLLHVFGQIRTSEFAANLVTPSQSQLRNATSSTDIKRITAVRGILLNATIYGYPRYVIVVEAMKMSVRTRPGPMQLIPNFILGLVRYSPMHTIHIGQLLRYAIV